MIYAVLLEDNPERAEMRAKFMADHLAFLERHADSIKAAGPLTECESDRAAGGLWIVNAADVAAVRSLIETDPLWPTGLRKSVRILAWMQVFCDGAKRI